jgi:hypothetical protein
MAKAEQKSLDKEVLAGIRKLKRLLSDASEFEKWANETLDMSRLRKR